MSQHYNDSNNLKLSIKQGGPTIIGQIHGDMVVAGKLDGSIFVGSPSKPLLGRTPSGDIMLILNSEFVANILPGGSLKILSGANRMVFRPGGITLLNSEINGTTSREVVDNIVALGANLMGWSNDYPLARVSPMDEITLKTTRKGATRISQPGRDFAIIAERDGSVYAGTADRPLLARMHNGDILLSLDDDFAAIIYRNGTIAICTSADCVLYAPGNEMMLSGGERNERAPDIIERLYDFGADMLRFDQEDDPAAEAQVIAAPPSQGGELAGADDDLLRAFESFEASDEAEQAGN